VNEVMVIGRMGSRQSIQKRGPTLFQALAGSHARVEPLIQAKSSDVDAE